MSTILLLVALISAYLGLLLPASIQLGSIPLSAFASYFILVAPGAIGTRILLKSTSSSNRTTLSIVGGCIGAIITLLSVALYSSDRSCVLLLMLGLETTVALLFLMHAPNVTISKNRIPIWYFLGVLILVFLPRLLSLGRAEYQGDEARALHLALATYHDEKDALFLHKKGPVEVLIPFSEMALTNESTEGGARLPFALWGGGVLILALLIGRILFPKSSSRNTLQIFVVIVGSLEGFLFAFSRIVQYQMPLLFFTEGALLFLLQLHEEERDENSARYIFFAALSFACALLCHYDAILFAPGLLLVLVWAYQKRGVSFSLVIQKLMVPLVVGILIVTSFYLPFIRHEHYAKTSAYLATRIGAGAFPHNTLRGYLNLLSFYNSLYLLIPLLALLLIGVGKELASRPQKISGKILGIAFPIYFLFSAYGATLFLIDARRSWSVIVAGFFFLALLVNKETSQEKKLLAVLTGVPLMAFSFFSARPNTHFYVLHPFAILLAGVFFAEFFGSTLIKGKRWIVLGISGILLLLSGWYVWMVYLRQDPEYRFVFPKARPGIYRAQYGDKLPGGAFFGFPHHSGWKVIGALYAQGVLKGSYSSNEETLITAWYTRGAIRNELDPDNFFIISHPNDPISYSPTKVRTTYAFLGRVSVGESKTIDIYQKGPQSDPKRYQSDDFIGYFDRLELPRYSVTAIIDQ